MSGTDLINRQAAIDELLALYEYQRSIDPTEAADLVRQGVFLAEKKIENLPSAQSEILLCKDCIYQTESWSGIKYCEAHGDHIGKDYDYCSNARRKDNG